MKTPNQAMQLTAGRFHRTYTTLHFSDVLCALNKLIVVSDATGVE